MRERVCMCCGGGGRAFLLSSSCPQRTDTKRQHQHQHLSNHTDSAVWSAEAARLGLGEPVAISATSGEGLADLYTALRPTVDAAAAARAAEKAAEDAAAAAAAAASSARRAAGAERAAGGGGGSSSGSSGGGGGGGFAARHHLAAAELEELEALRGAVGGALADGALDLDAVAGGEADEGEGEGDSGSRADADDLGEIDVDAATGEITVRRGDLDRSGGDLDSSEHQEQHEQRQQRLVETDASGDPLPAGPLRVAILGAPNAGKSTLLNSLLGWERALTGPEPGLTRDANKAWADWRGLHVELIDTAGWIKRAAALPGHADEASAAVAAMTQGAARRALEAAHVVVLLLDATTLVDFKVAMQRRDMAVASMAVREGKALVVALNKADLIAPASSGADGADGDGESDQEEQEDGLEDGLEEGGDGSGSAERARRRMSAAAAAAAAERLRSDVEAVLAARLTEAGRLPVLLTSALAGGGKGAILDAAVEAYARWNRR